MAKSVSVTLAIYLDIILGWIVWRAKMTDKLRATYNQLAYRKWPAGCSLDTPDWDNPTWTIVPKGGAMNSLGSLTGIYTWIQLNWYIRSTLLQSVHNWDIKIITWDQKYEDGVTLTECLRVVPAVTSWRRWATCSSGSSRSSHSIPSNFTAGSAAARRCQRLPAARDSSWREGKSPDNTSLLIPSSGLNPRLQAWQQHNNGSIHCSIRWKTRHRLKSWLPEWNTNILFYTQNRSIVL